jgi:hypothetical protein
MKKQLILTSFIVLSLAACTKDKSAVSSLTSKSGLTNSKVNTRVIQPTYMDMTYVPPAAGQTYGHYFAQWNDCGIQVTEPLSWDFIKYPNLINGVPVVASNLTTYDGTSSVVVVNAGVDGNVFEVTQVYLGGLPSTGFQTDYDKYIQSWDTYYSNGGTGTEPQLSVMLNTSYSAGGSSKHIPVS